MFEEKYEKAIVLMRRYIPDDDARGKPLIPHLLRVGMYLHDHGYSEAVVTAGLLHDMLEWSDCPPDILSQMFGPHVRAIVEANTKNRAIENPIERRIEYIARCAAVGNDALVVKAADALDSYEYYSKLSNRPEMARSSDIARLILDVLPAGMHDPIFNSLKKIAR